MFERRVDLTICVQRVPHARVRKSGEHVRLEAINGLQAMRARLGVQPVRQDPRRREEFGLHDTSTNTNGTGDARRIDHSKPLGKELPARLHNVFRISCLDVRRTPPSPQHKGRGGRENSASVIAEFSA